MHGDPDSLVNAFLHEFWLHAQDDIVNHAPVDTVDRKVFHLDRCTVTAWKHQFDNTGSR